MTEQYSIDRIQTDWKEIADELAKGNPVELLGTDKRIGILVSSDDDKRLAASQASPFREESFWDGYRAFRQKADSSAIDPDDDLFANVRDPSPGREVNW
ncbi:hypothetical protein [Synechococcus sp. PCC 7336]|uniref:hypothetical protein n=1 Tax=Synechococcus sp. PCC 7336 TaxID=195250 RepID=UPI00034982D8|nr:hypothetical protein [Synechococcus sp. PCC 7336]